MRLEVGERVSDYVVEGVLGEGKAAVVYRVRDAELGRVWALKVLHDRQATTRARLLREGRVLSTLRHPNVVQVVRYLEVNGAAALVMEFVPGPPLTSLMGRPLPVEEATRLVHAIASGLAAAHDLGVVHRDLRPQNVLLADPCEPKLADFGVALVPIGPTLTLTGASLGEPAYSAPEQLRDPRGVGPAADVYSLGVVYVELLTGRVPSGGRDLPSVLQAHARVGDSPLGASGLELDPAIVDLVRCCLAVDPSARPATARQVLAALPTAIAATRRARVQVLVTDAAGGGVVMPLLVDIVHGGGGVQAPVGTGAAAARAAEVAVLAAVGGVARGWTVRWTPQEPGFRVDGASIGLGLAAAVRMAWTGRVVDASLAYTGAVDLHGRLHPVAGVPAKHRAALAAGLRAVVPAGNAADAPGALVVAHLDELP